MRGPLPSIVGWFGDIFDAKLIFEESSYTTVPDTYERMHGTAPDRDRLTLKCFDGKGTISGKLLVAAPEGRAIGHRGIEISFQTLAYSPQQMSTVMDKAWTLLEAGEISEAIEIGFDIDLPELRSVLRDTFDGDHLQLRHTIGFRIVRPWCARQ